MLKEQRIKDREQAIVQKERKKMEEIELRNWEIMKKQKTVEYTEKYNNKRRIELWNQILEYRNALFDQMKHKEEEKQREKQEAIENLKELVATLRDEDVKFLRYAEEVLELCRKNGKPLYPIQKIIKVLYHIRFKHSW